MVDLIFVKLMGIFLTMDMLLIVHFTAIALK